MSKRQKIVVNHYHINLTVASPEQETQQDELPDALPDDYNAGEQLPDGVATLTEALDLEQQLIGMAQYHGTWDGSVTCSKTEVMCLINLIKQLHT